MDVSGPEVAELRRAVSPVVGVALMVVLVVVLSSAMAGLVLTYTDAPETPSFEEEVQDSPWDDDPLLGPEDATAGATDIRYRVYFEITDTNMEGDSLNGVRIFVNTTDDMFSGTSQDDLETLEVEKTDGTELDIKSDVDGWSTSNDGSQLDIGLSGSEYPNPSVGDTIIIIFDGVDNPADPGTYDVEVELNGDEDLQEGELEIVES